uniref:Protein kinase domain-containing protein n=1 Tax=Macrostomum lignano TaxID=282301 RepID=A0A1I8HG89_9PLAT
DSLGFATEPIWGSLANFLGKCDRISSSVPAEIKESLTDLEIKHGIFQINEALKYLHCTQKVIHGNLPKMAQPDLDYLAPDLQIYGKATQACDIFSLGLVIHAIFNGGVSLLDAGRSSQQYHRKVEELPVNLPKALTQLPCELAELVEKMLDREPRHRPSAQLLSMKQNLLHVGAAAISLFVLRLQNKYFQDPLLLALEGLVTCEAKTNILFKRVCPLVAENLQLTADLTPYVLPCLLRAVMQVGPEEFRQHLCEHTLGVLRRPKTAQVTLVLVEHSDVLVEKLDDSQVKGDLLPLVFTTLDSNSSSGQLIDFLPDPATQEAALSSFVVLQDHIDDATLRKLILPKAKALFQKNKSITMKVGVLSCLERLMDRLDKMAILEDLLPFLLEIGFSDPDIYMAVLNIYKRMLSDKRFGLSFNLIATKVLPHLIPYTVNPNLRRDDFRVAMETLNEMWNRLESGRSAQMRLEDAEGADSTDEFRSQDFHLTEAAPLLGEFRAGKPGPRLTACSPAAARIDRTELKIDPIRSDSEHTLLAPVQLRVGDPLKPPAEWRVGLRFGGQNYDGQVLQSLACIYWQLAGRAWNLTGRMEAIAKLLDSSGSNSARLSRALNRYCSGTAAVRRLSSQLAAASSAAGQSGGPEAASVPRRRSQGTAGMRTAAWEHLGGGGRGEGQIGLIRLLLERAELAGPKIYRVVLLNLASYLSDCIHCEPSAAVPFGPGASASIPVIGDMPIRTSPRLPAPDRTDPARRTSSSSRIALARRTSSSRTDPGRRTSSSSRTDPGRRTSSSSRTDPGQRTSSSSRTDPGRRTSSSSRTDPGQRTSSSSRTDPGSEPLLPVVLTRGSEPLVLDLLRLGLASVGDREQQCHGGHGRSERNCAGAGGRVAASSMDFVEDSQPQLLVAPAASESLLRAALMRSGQARQVQRVSRRSASCAISMAESELLQPPTRPKHSLSVPDEANRSFTLSIPSVQARRHSLTATAAAGVPTSSGVASGSFITPPSSRVSSRRPSAQSFLAEKLGTSPIRRSSFNALSDTVMATFFWLAGSADSAAAAVVAAATEASSGSSRVTPPHSRRKRRPRHSTPRWHWAQRTFSGDMQAQSSQAQTKARRLNGAGLSMQLSMSRKARAQAAMRPLSRQSENGSSSTTWGIMAERTNEAAPQVANGGAAVLQGRVVGQHHPEAARPHVLRQEEILGQVAAKVGQAAGQRIQDGLAEQAGHAGGAVDADQVSRDVHLGVRAAEVGRLDNIVKAGPLLGERHLVHHTDVAAHAANHVSEGLRQHADAAGVHHHADNVLGAFQAEQQLVARVLQGEVGLQVGVHVLVDAHQRLEDGDAGQAVGLRVAALRHGRIEHPHGNLNLLAVDELAVQTENSASSGLVVVEGYINRQRHLHVHGWLRRLLRKLLRRRLPCHAVAACVVFRFAGISTAFAASASGIRLVADASAVFAGGVAGSGRISLRLGAGWINNRRRRRWRRLRQRLGPGHGELQNAAERRKEAVELQVVQHRAEAEADAARPALRIGQNLTTDDAAERSQNPPDVLGGDPGWQPSVGDFQRLVVQPVPVEGVNGARGVLWQIYMFVYLSLMEALLHQISARSLQVGCVSCVTGPEPRVRIECLFELLRAARQLPPELQQLVVEFRQLGAAPHQLVVLVCDGDLRIGATECQNWCNRVPELVQQSARIGATECQNWCNRVPELVQQSAGIGATERQTRVPDLELTSAWRGLRHQELALLTGRRQRIGQMVANGAESRDEVVCVVRSPQAPRVGRVGQAAAGRREGQSGVGGPGGPGGLDLLAQASSGPTDVRGSQQAAQEALTSLVRRGHRSFRQAVKPVHRVFTSDQVARRFQIPPVFFWGHRRSLIAQPVLLQVLAGLQRYLLRQWISRTSCRRGLFRLLRLSGSSRGPSFSQFSSFLCKSHVTGLRCLAAQAVLELRLPEEGDQEFREGDEEFREGDEEFREGDEEFREGDEDFRESSQRPHLSSEEAVFRPAPFFCITRQVTMYLNGLPRRVSWLTHCSMTDEVHWPTLLCEYLAKQICKDVIMRKEISKDILQSVRCAPQLRALAASSGIDKSESARMDRPELRAISGRDSCRAGGVPAPTEALKAGNGGRAAGDQQGDAADPAEQQEGQLEADLAAHGRSRPAALGAAVAVSALSVKFTADTAAAPRRDGKPALHSCSAMAASSADAAGCCDCAVAEIPTSAASSSGRPARSIHSFIRTQSSANNLRELLVSDAEWPVKPSGGSGRLGLLSALGRPGLPVPAGLPGTPLRQEAPQVRAPREPKAGVVRQARPVEPAPVACPVREVVRVSRDAAAAVQAVQQAGPHPIGAQQAAVACGGGGGSGRRMNAECLLTASSLELTNDDEAAPGPGQSHINLILIRDEAEPDRLTLAGNNSLHRGIGESLLLQLLLDDADLVAVLRQHPDGALDKPARTQPLHDALVDAHLRRVPQNVGVVQHSLVGAVLSQQAGPGRRAAGLQAGAVRLAVLAADVVKILSGEVRQAGVLRGFELQASAYHSVLVAQHDHVVRLVLQERLAQAQQGGRLVLDDGAQLLVVADQHQPFGIVRPQPGRHLRAAIVHAAGRCRPKPTTGTRVSGWVHMPASSMMIWQKRQDFCSRPDELTEVVHKTTSKRCRAMDLASDSATRYSCVMVDRSMSHGCSGSFRVGSVSRAYSRRCALRYLSRSGSEGSIWQFRELKSSWKLRKILSNDLSSRADFPLPVRTTSCRVTGSSFGRDLRLRVHLRLGALAGHRVAPLLDLLAGHADNARTLQAQPVLQVGRHNVHRRVGRPAVQHLSPSLQLLALVPTFGDHFHLHGLLRLPGFFRLSLDAHLLVPDAHVRVRRVLVLHSFLVFLVVVHRIVVIVGLVPGVVDAAVDEHVPVGEHDAGGGLAGACESESISATSRKPDDILLNTQVAQMVQLLQGDFLPPGGQKLVDDFNAGPAEALLRRAGVAGHFVQMEHDKSADVNFWRAAQDGLGVRGDVHRHDAAVSNPGVRVALGPEADVFGVAQALDRFCYSKRLICWLRIMNNERIISGGCHGRRLHRNNWKPDVGVMQSIPIGIRAGFISDALE